MKLHTKLWNKFELVYIVLYNLANHFEHVFHNIMKSLWTTLVKVFHNIMKSLWKSLCIS